jgi:hypothetical protein
LVLFFKKEHASFNKELFMRVLIPLLLAWPSIAVAQVTPTDQTEIQRVISAQIAAFRRDDGNAALAFATPGIQAKFGDGAHFLAVVRSTYPAVFRPRSFHFAELDPIPGGATQRVDIVGPSGEAVHATYGVAHEADGSWRISGCDLAATGQTEL